MDHTPLLYRPIIQTLINILVPALCLLSVIAEWFVHRHPHFKIEEIMGFYGIYGFVSYCFIVLTAKALRPLLRRDENYYD